jgi:hypothetical protein
MNSLAATQGINSGAQGIISGFLTGAGNLRKTGSARPAHPIATKGFSFDERK